MDADLGRAVRFVAGAALIGTNALFLAVEDCLDGIVDLKFLVVYLEKHYGLSNEKRIEDVIKVVANENRYHPVLDRINSITWDGRERIRYALHHFLGAEVSEYTYEVMKLFMIGTIARISCPGIKFEVMLCLVGGQGAGKSTFLRFLAMEDDWFTDDLKKMDDDNVYRKIQGHLIIEFPEMVAILNAKNVEDTSGVSALKVVIIAVGGGLAVLGVVNLLEGYGNDNPGANAHVR